MNALARLAAFAAVYLVHQMVGLAALAWLMLTGRRSAYEPHRRVQAWWVDSLLKWARRLLGLEIIWPDVNLPSGRFIVLSRHCSPVDAALPAQWVAHHHDRPVHYVLKQQLRFDPCISLFGARLGNAFIDRSDSNEALASIGAMSAEAQPEAGVVIFPEGTYFSPERRDRALARLERSADDAAVHYAQSLRHLLPPRPAGTLLALDELPDADVVLIAPIGLDGLATPAALLRRVPLTEAIPVRLRLVARPCIPDEYVERRKWLNEMWKSMDEAIDAVPDAPEPPWI